MHPHVCWVALCRHEVLNERHLLDRTSRLTTRQNLPVDCIVQSRRCETIHLLRTRHLVEESESAIHIPQGSSVGWLRSACPEEPRKVFQRSGVRDFVRGREPREVVAQEYDPIPQRSCSSARAQLLPPLRGYARAVGSSLEALSVVCAR